MVFASTNQTTTGRYTCAKYRRYGCNECSPHKINLSDLNEVVLNDIRRHAVLSAADRDKYVEYLMGLSQRDMDGERDSWVKEAERCRRRLDELDVILRNLYEDNVFNRISSERYVALSSAYEEEEKKLKDRYMELRDRMDSYGKHSRSSEEFADLVAGYTDIHELTEELLNTLVDRIVVHEKEIVDGKTFMRVDIHYRFIGSVGGESGEGIMARDTIRPMRKPVRD